MARYLITWKANASAWPTDPKAALALLEGAIRGGNMLREQGFVKDIGWLSAEEGFGIFEADSKATVVGLVSPFFPLYSQQIREIGEWDASSDAALGMMRQIASM